MTVIYWRDIPSQVVVRKQGDSAKALLPDLFQHAIDRAAMRAGKAESHVYLEEWQRVVSDVSVEGTASTVANREMRKLVEKYSSEDLNAMIRNHGRRVDQ